MKTNKYDFPVLEINKDEVKQMKIQVYPTTYLITPENKFIIFPSFSDKEELIKIFTLLEW
jgi:hypothetical protein